MRVISKTEVEIFAGDKITRPVYDLVKALESIDNARMVVEVRGSKPSLRQVGSLEDMFREARRRGEL